MTEILIRQARKSDILAIQKLLSTYFLDMEDLESEDFILAEVEGRITGCAVLIKFESQGKHFMEIHSIAVHPNFRGKGIGRQLIEHFLKSCSVPDCEIYVRTTSPAFFEKMNFARIENSQKSSIWEDCKQCEYFDKCAQYAMKYLYP